MATAHADADEAVLKMLDRYGVLMLEDLMTGERISVWHNCFSLSNG
jgi:hypothetical protein